MEIAPQVKDMTEVVQNLPTLLSAILELVTTPEGTILIILFLIWLPVNSGGFSRALDMLERKERRRLEQINEYLLSHEAADPETIKVVRDLRDAHYFKVATGIYAENRTRSAFIKMHQLSSHCISWKHIERARPYIDIAADETISIRDLTFIEKISYWYNQFVAYGSICFSILLFIAKFAFAENKTIMLFGANFATSLLLALFGLCVFIQNSPVRAKERIAKELERLRDCIAE
ncbi:MAG: hypothetical protein ACXV9T_15900 [Methylobacter sp.]